MRNTKHKALGVLLIIAISFSFAGITSAATKSASKQVKPQNTHVPSNISGTITAINGSVLTVNIKDKKATISKTVILNDKTKFNVKKDKSAKGSAETVSLANFKVGDRVNINGKPNTDGTMTARILRLTPPKHKKK